MTFIEMRDLLNQHFAEMVKDATHLFEVQVNKDEMVNLYLDSFPNGTNEIYRKRRQFDCSCCRGFIKNLGNVVAIKDNKLETIWSFDPGDDIFAPVIKIMDEYIRDHAISDVFLSANKNIGCHHNFEILEKMTPKQWDHFFVELDDRFVIQNPETKNAELDKFRSAHDVLKRSLDEITPTAIDIILELIHSNTLYKGMEYKDSVTKLQKMKAQYDTLTDTEKELFVWQQSAKNPIASHIRNQAIGTLLLDVSSGKPLEDSVRSYEAITAPSNYKRSKPIFSQRELDATQAVIEANGFKDSLPRRHAALSDITVNDILFVNKDAASRVQGAKDIFAELSTMTSGKSKPQKFSKVEEISIENFLLNVVPTATSIEAYFSNDLIPNLMSLIAPVNPNAKSMFKWENNFTWAYRGNITDSMKERVKAAGGRVDGDLRFSIQWNEDGRDDCDLDAHCVEADGFEIYYNKGCKNSNIKYSHTKGQLDVDIRVPGKNIAVENITWADKKTLTPGIYKFFVKQYDGSAKSGFRAEIEIEGKIYNFNHPHSMRTNEKVEVAYVIVTRENGINKLEIKPILSCQETTQEVWNLQTNQFVPVTVICNSPNYWDNVKNPTGHKHVFFMLKDCINDENPSGIFNEFLCQELYEHRRVMEAIGGRMRVADSTDQLSGLGFATDKRAELTVRATGATERILKIKF